MNGLIVCNSALDPYDGGGSADESQSRLLIVRNIAHGYWDPAYRGRFENTLNQKPYQLNVTVYDRDSGGDPIPDPDKPGRFLLRQVPVVLPGHGRIKSLKTDRLPATGGPHPARRRWYWRLVAEVVIDDTAFIDNNGSGSSSGTGPSSPT